MKAAGIICRKRLGAAVLIAAFVLSALLWGACASKPAPKPAASAQGIKTILVLPFVDMAAIYGQDQGVRSPISGQAFVTGPVDADAADFLAQQMMLFIGGQPGFTAVPAEDAEAAMGEVMSQRGVKMLSPEAVCQVGRMLGVDGVVAGHVYRFKDRVGKAYSVDTPASVAFGVHLLRVSDGSIVWSGRFDETQKALSDNLFEINKFVQRGGTWVTAQKLASAGLDNALKSFPKP